MVEYLVNTYGEDQIAELTRAIKRTFDIDKALEDTYGFDVYGLDSEWRVFLGVEPLPRPEEPAPQPRATSTPRPTPTPFPIAAATPSSTPMPTPLPTPLAVVPATPAPTAEPEPAAPIVDAGEESPSTSPGCMRPGCFL